MPQILGKKYKVFTKNDYRNLMPQLIKTGLVPMNMADVMRSRLGSVKYNKHQQKEFWLSKSFDTADGAAYYNDKVKIVYDASALKEIQPDMKLSEEALILTPKQYKALEGEEFSRHDLEKSGVSTWLTKSGAKSHPVWQSLARDNHLLSEYVDLIFAEMKKITDRDTAMGVYLSTEQINPTMRAWSVGNISYGRGSDVNSNLDFIDRYAHLVGVRAEDVSKNETLDKIIDSLEARKAFKYNGQLYVPVSQDSGLNIQD